MTGCGSGCGTGGGECCKVEAIVGVDERGQLVLPKELRTKAGIGPGEKLAIVSFQQGGDVYCLALMKADKLAETVQGMLGPLLGGRQDKE